MILRVVAGAFLAAASLVSPAFPAFPDRPITLVVPYAAGGNVDVTARIVAESLEKILKQPVVVENKLGAGGAVGAATVARAAPNGYTLLVGSNGPLSVNPAVQSKMPYDANADFAPIGLISQTPLVLAVSPAFGPKTTAELIDYAKKQRVRAASGGVAQSTHLAIELFNMMAGVKMAHIPYAGQGALYPDLIGNHVDLTFDQITTAIPLAEKGQARILAITSLERSPLLPQTPTLDELGLKGYFASSFVSLVAPAKTPNDVMKTLTDALNKAIEDPNVRGRLEKMGAWVKPSTPEQLREFIRDDYERSRKIAEQAGIRLN